MGSDAQLALRGTYPVDTEPEPQGEGTTEGPKAVEGTTQPQHDQPNGAQPQKDFFIERDGARYAGTHLIVDLWDADNLDDLDLMERTLREAVDASGATLLHIHLHHFEPNGGVSGVAVLAESHISVHTWPERHYAAFDAFMCGDADPARCVPVFDKAFEPGRIEVQTHLRGKAS